MPDLQDTTFDPSLVDPSLIQMDNQNRENLGLKKLPAQTHPIQGSNSPSGLATHSTADISTDSHPSTHSSWAEEVEESLSQQTPSDQTSNASSSASSTQRTPQQAALPPTTNLQPHHTHLPDIPSSPPSHETYLSRLDLIECYANSTLNILCTHPPIFKIIHLISSCDDLLNGVGHVRDELQAVMALEKDNLADFFGKQVCDLEAQMEGIEEKYRGVHGAGKEEGWDSQEQEQGEMKNEEKEGQEQGQEHSQDQGHGQGQHRGQQHGQHLGQQQDQHHGHNQHLAQTPNWASSCLRNQEIMKRRAHGKFSPLFRELMMTRWHHLNAVA